MTSFRRPAADTLTASEMSPGLDFAAGLDRRPMTVDDLPPVDTERWVVRRKATVVAGVRAGLISLEEASRRYALSVEEFLSWERGLDRHGLSGLRARIRSRS